MKTAIGSVVAAVAASACCLGPVLLTAVGAGALGAAATKLAPHRPFLLGLTTVLLGVGFYATYRPVPDTCAPDETCRPSPTRAAKVALWVATALVIIIATFPYYVNWLL